MPVAVKPAPEGHSLTAEQARTRLKTAEGDPLEGLRVTGLMMRLWPGELTGLLWVDVDLDLDAPTLQVRRSLKNERSGLRLGDPKTRRSFRRLDMPPQVVAALRAHRDAPEHQGGLAATAWVEHGLVFTTPVGTTLDPANLRRTFSALTRRGPGSGIGHPRNCAILRVVAVRRRGAAGADRRCGGP